MARRDLATELVNGLQESVNLQNCRKIVDVCVFSGKKDLYFIRCFLIEL